MKITNNIIKKALLFKCIVLYTLISLGQETVDQKINFLITDKQVGIFKIGETIPFEKVEELSYEIKKENLKRYTEEGEVEEPYYIISKNDEILIKIKPDYNYDTNTYTEKIGEIFIISNRIKTPKGVGVGTEIQEFIKLHPDFKLWYTYVSGMYVIETNDINAQFLIDENDFIGKMEISGDMTILKISDFKKTSKIKTIRII